ncbi:hypothetical protein Tco_1059941 [Tanacetum coccineum]
MFRVIIRLIDSTLDLNVDTKEHDKDDDHQETIRYIFDINSDNVDDFDHQVDIVNEVQSAFVADRQILDGPFILNEVLQWCTNAVFMGAMEYSWQKMGKMVAVFKVGFIPFGESFLQDTGWILEDKRYLWMVTWFFANKVYPLALCPGSVEDCRCASRNVKSNYFLIALLEKIIFAKILPLVGVAFNGKEALRSMNGFSAYIKSAIPKAYAELVKAIFERRYEGDVGENKLTPWAAAKVEERIRKSYSLSVHEMNSTTYQVGVTEINYIVDMGRHACTCRK